jgi:hypothetical protein
MDAALVDSSLTLLNSPYDLQDGNEKFVGWIKRSESTENFVAAPAQQIRLQLNNCKFVCFLDNK